MGLHFWLVPMLAILSVAVLIFYLAIRQTGGTGVRTEGRVILDRPVDDEHHHLG